MRNSSVIHFFCKKILPACIYQLCNAAMQSDWKLEWQKPKFSHSPETRADDRSALPSLGLSALSRFPHGQTHNDVVVLVSYMRPHNWTQLCVWRAAEIADSRVCVCAYGGDSYLIRGIQSQSSAANQNPTHVERKTKTRQTDRFLFHLLVLF